MSDDTCRKLQREGEEELWEKEDTKSEPEPEILGSISRYRQTQSCVSPVLSYWSIHPVFCYCFVFWYWSNWLRQVAAHIDPGSAGACSRHWVYWVRVSIIGLVDVLGFLYSPIGFFKMTSAVN